MNQLTPIPRGSMQTKPLSKGDVFRILNQNISLNNFMLPDHIYRSDLVGMDIFDLPPKDRSLILDSASLPLSFDHGYPAINETDPFWEQLPCEPPEAYDAYLKFLELPEKSAHDNPIRLLPFIATLCSRTLKEITDWCHQFYWHWRARAYDLFLVAAHRKMKEQRIMSIEGAHFKQAEILLDKIQKLANAKLDQEIQVLQSDGEAETETKLKDLVTMAKDLIGIQRISVGLPMSGPSSIDIKIDAPRHTTVEETFKSIAKEGAGEQKPNQRSQEMDELLKNPDDLSCIQDLMIRMSAPQHTLPVWGTGLTVDFSKDSDDSDSDNTGSALNTDDGEDSGVEDLGNPT